MVGAEVVKLNHFGSDDLRKLAFVRSGKPVGRMHREPPGSSRDKGELFENVAEALRTPPYRQRIGIAESLEHDRTSKGQLPLGQDHACRGSHESIPLLYWWNSLTGWPSQEDGNGTPRRTDWSEVRLARRKPGEQPGTWVTLLLPHAGQEFRILLVETPQQNVSSLGRCVQGSRNLHAESVTRSLFIVHPAELVQRPLLSGEAAPRRAAGSTAVVGSATAGEQETRVAVQDRQRIAQQPVPQPELALAASPSSTLTIELRYELPPAAEYCIASSSASTISLGTRPERDPTLTIRP
jgi:hypothetical protein